MDHISLILIGNVQFVTGSNLRCIVPRASALCNLLSYFAEGEGQRARMVGDLVCLASNHRHLSLGLHNCNTNNLNSLNRVPAVNHLETSLMLASKY